MASKNGDNLGKGRKPRAYISQADIPSFSLNKAIKIPACIGDNYGFHPSTPLQVAKALEIQPSSGHFRMLTGASVAYGLTSGAYNAETISITPLGMRVVRPTADGDDVVAKREALLKPRVIREFLQKYNNASIPNESIARNVLNDMGVPIDRTGDVLKLILEGADNVGFLQEIKGRKYVELNGANAPTEPFDKDRENESGGESGQEVPSSAAVRAPTGNLETSTTVKSDGRGRRVFITHGKNRDLIEPIKKLLNFGELEAVVSVQTQTVSQPVTEKVMGEMRSCGAAVIHVEDERHLVDAEGHEHIALNDNVLIEIGAAMALFGRRFILIVKEGVTLPSNIQGLLELRYKGATLDMEETVKLLEAINDMKKRPLPQPAVSNL